MGLANDDNKGNSPFQEKYCDTGFKNISSFFQPLSSVSVNFIVEIRN